MVRSLNEVSNLYWSNKNKLNELPKFALISIRDIEAREKLYFAIDKLCAKNPSLILHFADNDGDRYDANTFTSIQAQQIVEFVKKIVKSKREIPLIVHCTAGISRSGAVGEVINDYLKFDYKQFKRDNPQVQPNCYVKKTLNIEFVGEK
jgi:predicted protein tyrosine phosphatase